MKIRRFNESKSLDLKDEFQGIIDILYDNNLEFKDNLVIIYLDEFFLDEKIIDNRNFELSLKESIEKKELEIEFYRHLSIILNKLSDYGYFFEFKQESSEILKIEFKEKLKDNIEIEDFLIPNIGNVYSTFSGDHLDITHYKFNKLKFIKYFNQEYNVDLSGYRIEKDKKSECVIPFYIPDGSMTYEELYGFLDKLNKHVFIKDGKEYKSKYNRFSFDNGIRTDYPISSFKIRFDKTVYIV